MWGILEGIFGFFLKIGLGKLAQPILDFMRTLGDSANEAKKIEMEERVARMQAQVQEYQAAVERSKVQMTYVFFWVLVFLLMGPMILKWTMINLYDVFWCSKCMFPQGWIIAAYQPPFDTWAQSMVAWVFGPAVGVGVVIAAAKTMR